MRLRWRGLKTFKFLGTYTREDLTWSHNTQQIIKNPTEAAPLEKTEEI